MDKLQARAEAIGYGWRENNGTISLFSGQLVAFVGSSKKVQDLVKDIEKNKQRNQRPVSLADQALDF